MSTFTVDTTELRDHVREMYRAVAREPGGDYHFETGRALAERLGYPADWLDAVPADALASFAGVGHFLDLAQIAPGDSVVDLGSGSGTDSFIAAKLTGPDGQVVGVDMTDAQLMKARHARDCARARPPRVPQRADRGSAGRARWHRRRDLQRRHQPRSRQGARVPRRGPRTAPGRTARDRRHHRRARADQAAPQRRPVDRVHRRRHAAGDYLEAIESAGLRVQMVRANPAYRFLSPRAQDAAAKYGVTSLTSSQSRRTPR